MVSIPLRFELGIAAGNGNLEVDVQHRLAAAVRRGIEDGKPTGKWTFLAIRSEDEPEARVVGTLLYSPGRRFLFYPGASVYFSEQVYEVDHLTLDRPNGDQTVTDGRRISPIEMHPKARNTVQAAKQRSSMEQCCPG